ncbi:MAG: hypothetical protein MUE73_06330 [Planctomycetes bacterium]|nr:hypothetical protein [Planctomycetota bacterium]
MVRIAALLCLAFAPLAGARAGPAPARADPEAALRRALPWLVERLPRLPDVKGTPRRPFTCAVAGLVALLAPDAGLPGGGEETLRHVRGVLGSFLDDVERRVGEPDSLPPRHGLASSEYLIQYTWPLAAAALFYSEQALRGIEREASAAALRRILAVLADAQAENGGFGHGRIRPAGATTPGPRRAAPDLLPEIPAGAGYPETLLAATNCAAAGIGAAARVLGRESYAGRDRLIAYYRKARLPNGSFPYDPSQRSAGADGTGVGRAAGAMLALHALGVPAADPDFAAAFDFVVERLDRIAEGHGSPALNVALAGLAFRALGGAAFARFRAEYFPRIAAAQEKDGSFRCVCRKEGFGVTCDSDPAFAAAGFLAESQHLYVTALHALVLLLDRAPPKFLAAPAPWPAPPPPRPPPPPPVPPPPLSRAGAGPGSPGRPSARSRGPATRAWRRAGPR